MKSYGCNLFFNAIVCFSLITKHFLVWGEYEKRYAK